MDKNKVKFVTLEELKNIDPSLINFMTFTDGTVAMVDSDKEDDESEEKDNNKNEMNQDEKEPDIQNDPNMYLNFESESENYEQNNNKVNNNYINNYNNNKKENNINNNYRINRNLYNANNQRLISNNKMYNQQNASFKYISCKNDNYKGFKYNNSNCPFCTKEKYKKK